MSHSQERKADDCLNCNAKVYGKYCHVCGQENVEPSESAWQLVTHFFYDLVHFDGKFFSTLKLLIFKPGFLSREYMLGRRASYLNPIRMYIFTSAVFFFIFFSFVSLPTREGGFVFGNNLKDTASINKMTDSAYSAYVTLKKRPGLPREQYAAYKDSLDMQGLHFTRKYDSKEQYDSVLASGEKKHNWLERQLIYKEIELNKKYNNNTRLMGKAFLDNFLHSFPQILFLSLPLFALFLKLIYVRKKQFYYVSHAIFSVHFYIFVFIVLFVIMMLNKLKGFSNFGLIETLKVILQLCIYYYLYKAMRNFYQQGRGKTLLKYLLLIFWLLFVTMILFVIFLILSFYKI